MEILKFDDSEKSLPSKKPSGRGAILVAFIALVFGAGTALAGGTLQINNADNTIALDQGVATTLTCDESIDVSFGTDLDQSLDEPEFKLNSVTVENISDDCDGKDFVLKVYDNSDPWSLQVFCDGFNPGCNMGTSLTKTLSTDPATSLTFEFTPILSTANVKHITIETTG